MGYQKTIIGVEEGHKQLYHLSKALRSSLLPGDQCDPALDHGVHYNVENGGGDCTPLCDPLSAFE